MAQAVTLERDGRTIIFGVTKTHKYRRAALFTKGIGNRAMVHAGEHVYARFMSRVVIPNTHHSQGIFAHKLRGTRNVREGCRKHCNHRTLHVLEAVACTSFGKNLHWYGLGLRPSNCGVSISAIVP